MIGPQYKQQMNPFMEAMHRERPQLARLQDPSMQPPEQVPMPGALPDYKMPEFQSFQAGPWMAQASEGYQTPTVQGNVELQGIADAYAQKALSGDLTDEYKRATEIALQNAHKVGKDNLINWGKQ